MSTVTLKNAVKLAVLALGATACGAAIAASSTPIFATQLSRASDMPGAIDGDLPLAYRVVVTGNSASVVLAGVAPQDITGFFVDGVEIDADKVHVESVDGGVVITLFAPQITESVGFTTKFGASVTLPTNFASSTAATVEGSKAAVVPPKITAISYNGTWAGQPSRAPASASNVTKGFYAADYLSAGQNDTITISGTGFGTTVGTLTVSDTQLLISVKSWSNTSITARVMTRSPGYSYARNVRVSVTNAATRASTSNASLNVAGAVQTRPWGQCTWYVTQKLITAGLTTPNAPYYSASINTDLRNWTPQPNDALVFGASAHTAIIDSVTSTSVVKNGVVTVTYSIAISDYNAAWDEKLGTKTLTFAKTKKQSTGVSIAVTATPSRGGNLYGYFRPTLR